MSEEGTINKKIEELKQQKKELLVKQGKAYKCTSCGEIDTEEHEGLCYKCWSETVKERKRKELMQTFKDAKIIDIEPKDNPYSSSYMIKSVTLEVGKEQYKLQRDCDGICISLLKV